MTNKDKMTNKEVRIQEVIRQLDECLDQYEVDSYEELVEVGGDYEEQLVNEFKSFGEINYLDYI